MEYLEIHITKRNLERIIFISFILVLSVLCFFALKDESSCPEIVCEGSGAEKTTGVVAGDVEEAAVEETAEGIVEAVIEEVVEKPVVYHVDIENYNFAPKELIIRKDSEIVFRNNQNMAHKLYEIRGLFFSPRMNPLDEFSFIFNQTGNFTIFSIMGKEKGTKMDVQVIE